MIKEKFENLSERLGKVSTWKIIIGAFFMCMFITFLQQIAFHLWGTINVDVLEQMFVDIDAEHIHISRTFFFGVIYGPLIETLIHQTAVMNIFFIFDYEYEYKIGLPIIVSALIFGAAHWGMANNIADNTIKLIGSSLIGLVLTYTYAIFHQSNRKATLYTFVVHGMLNMYSSTPAILFIRLYDLIHKI